MKWIFLLFLIIAPCFNWCGSVKTLESINSNNDRGFWLEQFLRKKFESNWVSRFHTQQRWGADYRQIFFQQYELFIQHDMTRFLCKPWQKIFDGVVFGPGLNYTRSIRKRRAGEFHWKWLRKPMLEVQLFSSIGKWRFRQRIRAEYIDYFSKHEEKHGVGRYRLELYTPWEFTCWKINPFMWNEWFFRRQSYSHHNHSGLIGGWFENRLRTGMIIKFFKNLSCTLYWQCVARKQKPNHDPRWNKTYQIGLITDITF